MFEQYVEGTRPFVSLATEQFDTALALTIALTIRSCVIEAKETLLPRAGSGWKSRVVFEVGFILMLVLLLFVMRLSYTA